VLLNNKADRTLLHSTVDTVMGYKCFQLVCRFKPVCYLLYRWKTSSLMGR